MAAADEWLDAEQAALLLGLPTKDIYRMIDGGRLKALSFPVRIRRQELDDCLERCRIKPGELPWASRSTGRGVEPPITSKGVPIVATAPATAADQVADRLTVGIACRSLGGIRGTDAVDQTRFGHSL